LDLAFYLHNYSKLDKYLESKDGIVAFPGEFENETSTQLVSQYKGKLQ